MRSVCCLLLLLVLVWPLTRALEPECLEHAKYKTSVWRPDPSKKKLKGIEYDGISRGSLLHVLAKFAQSVEGRLRGRNLRPQLTAQFDNNKYTRPFIYPQFFKTK